MNGLDELELNPLRPLAANVRGKNKRRAAPKNGGVIYCRRHHNSPPAGQPRQRYSHIRNTPNKKRRCAAYIDANSDWGSDFHIHS